MPDVCDRPHQLTLYHNFDQWFKVTSGPTICRTRCKVKFSVYLTKYDAMKTLLN